MPAYAPIQQTVIVLNMSREEVIRMDPNNKRWRTSIVGCSDPSSFRTFIFESKKSAKKFIESIPGKTVMTTDVDDTAMEVFIRTIIDLLESYSEEQFNPHL